MDYGSIIGGAIGALGSALAVYLTLRGQRNNEVNNITNAAYTEIMEFTKIAIGSLETCQNIYSKIATVPKEHFPSVTQAPTPIIYSAIADRIGLLEEAVVIVTFYSRFDLAKINAAMIAASRVSTVNHGSYEEVTDLVVKNEAAIAAEDWITICQLGLIILEKWRPNTVLEQQARQIKIADIKSALEIAKKIFPNAESFNDVVR